MIIICFRGGWAVKKVYFVIEQKHLFSGTTGMATNLIVERINCTTLLTLYLIVPVLKEKSIYDQGHLITFLQCEAALECGGKMWPISPSGHLLCCWDVAAAKIWPKFERGQLHLLCSWTQSTRSHCMHKLPNTHSAMTPRMTCCRRKYLTQSLCCSQTRLKTRCIADSAFLWTFYFENCSTLHKNKET